MLYSKTYDDFWRHHQLVMSGRVSILPVIGDPTRPYADNEP